MPTVANPTLADLATLAAEVQRRHARVTPGDLIVNRYDQDDGTIEYQIQATGAGRGAVLGELTDRDSKRAGFDAEAFVYNRTACPALAAFTSAIAPALAEWVAAHRACDAAGEAVKASIGPEAGREGRAYLAASSVRDAAKRRLAAADRALRVAAAGMVAE